VKAIIIDTNILFSALLGKNEKFREILLATEKVKLYTSKYALVELFKYKEKIRKYSNLNDEEVLELLYSLLKNINRIDLSTITDESLKRAFYLCKDIDEKDIPFVAITIELDGVLWTRDKKLITGLKTKDFTAFFEIR
jgi:predicted nucleic acid-binding protein